MDLPVYLYLVLQTKYINYLCILLRSALGAEDMTQQSRALASPPKGT